VLQWLLIKKWGHSHPTSPIQSINFPENLDRIQSLGASNPCPTLGCLCSLGKYSDMVCCTDHNNLMLTAIRGLWRIKLLLLWSNWAVSIKAQIPLGSWHVSTRSTCRASWDERIEPCCSNMVDDEQAAHLYKCSRFYAFTYTNLIIPSNWNKLNKCIL